MDGDFYPDRPIARLGKEGSVLLRHVNWPGCLLRPSRHLLRRNFRALPEKYTRDEAVERKLLDCSFDLMIENFLNEYSHKMYYEGGRAIPAKMKPISGMHLVLEKQHRHSRVRPVILLPAIRLSVLPVADQTFERYTLGKSTAASALVIAGPTFLRLKRPYKHATAELGRREALTDFKRGVLSEGGAPAVMTSKKARMLICPEAQDRPVTYVKWCEVGSGGWNHDHPAMEALGMRKEELAGLVCWEVDIHYRSSRAHASQSRSSTPSSSSSSAPRDRVAQFEVWFSTAFNQAIDDHLKHSPRPPLQSLTLSNVDAKRRKLDQEYPTPADK